MILGASARAAAYSTLRFGLLARCVDYFADRDLAAVCPTQRVDPAQGVGAFVAAAESLPPSTWIYTGGLENHPDAVERIARRHRLWGIGAESLRGIRDPVRVARVLDEAGFPVPEVRLEPPGLPRDGSWLVKPLASGGGRGIRPLTADADVFGAGSARSYYQLRMAGPSFSALFVGRGDWGRVRLVGVTRQWIGGVPDCPFAYRGSIGPSPVAGPLAARLRELGSRLAAAFDLIGWFGVDFVLQGDTPWMVEVNPRYTASVEIHELASGRSLLADHRAACEAAPEPVRGPEELGVDARPSRTIAKWILYAPRPLNAPEIAAPRYHPGDPYAIPSIADVPEPGTGFAPGDPLLTLFAAAREPRRCHRRLLRLRRSWARRLGWLETEPDRPGAGPDSLGDEVTDGDVALD